MILLFIAIAAMDLYRLGGCPHGSLRRVNFRHGSAEGEIQVIIFFPGGTETGQPGSIDAGSHIRQLELDDLVVHDLFAKGLSLLAVLEGLLVSPAGVAQCLGCIAVSATREHLL